MRNTMPSSSSSSSFPSQDGLQVKERVENRKSLRLACPHCCHHFSTFEIMEKCLGLGHLPTWNFRMYTRRSSPMQISMYTTREENERRKEIFKSLIHISSSFLYKYFSVSFFWTCNI